MRFTPRCPRSHSAVLFVTLALLSNIALLSEVSAQQANDEAEASRRRELGAPAEIKRKLADYRAEISRRGLGYGVGYTRVMDQPRESLLGDRDDPSQTRDWRLNINRQADILLKVDASARVSFLLQNPDRRRTLPDIVNKVEIECNASLKSFDWRPHGKVTPVRRQTCGNCWAFAAVATYESSNLMTNATKVDGSEQYSNDCGMADAGGRAGSCQGGLAVNALQHFLRVGEVTEKVSKYLGKDSACRNPSPTLYAAAWGFVDPNVEHPTRQQIKDALCNRGPLATRMRVVSDAIFSYKTGVYNEPVESDDAGGGHAVVIGRQQSRLAGEEFMGYGLGAGTRAWLDRL